MSEKKTFTVHIEKTLFGGYGLTHYDGKALLVRSALAGDHVEVKIDKDAPRYRKASIVQHHTQRNEMCRFATSCGGCPWDGVTPEQQRLWKQSFVEEALSRASLKTPQIPLPHSGDLHGVRHRVELQMQWANEQVTVGYYAPQSRQITPIQTCLVTTPALQSVIQGLYEFKAQKNKLGHYRLHIQELKTGVVILVKLPLHGRRSSPSKGFLQFLKKIPSVVWAGTLQEKSEILPWEEDLQLKWSTSPGLFQQVHRPLNHKMRRLVQSWVEQQRPSHILDLCCGSGNLSLALSHSDRKVTGVESNSQAIAVAQHQVQENKLNHISYHTAAAETWLSENTDKDFDLVIVDPPRSGLKDLIPHLRELAPQTLIMISCDPPTLARDIQLLGDEWQIKSIELFDFFPNTWHVETAALLTRG
ncbi:MAG: class I SAM-dependent RNA methyltransferase [Oligoflexales bacterium]